MEQIIERTHHLELAQRDDGRLAIRPREDTGRSRGWRERFRAARRFIQDLETFDQNNGAPGAVFRPGETARAIRVMERAEAAATAGSADGRAEWAAHIADEETMLDLIDTLAGRMGDSRRLERVCERAGVPVDRTGRNLERMADLSVRELVRVVRETGRLRLRLEAARE